MAPPGPGRLPPNNGNNPKRHHVVPRFYLERFAVKNRVELVDRGDFAKSFPPTPVERVLTERYFYSVDTEIGREPLGEIFLSDHVDTPGSVAIRRMFDERQPLTESATRQTISMFIAFQLVRGRSTREALIEYDKASMRVLASMQTAADVLEGARQRGEAMTEEEAAETAEDLKTGRYEFEPVHPANVHIGSILPAPSETVRFFYGRKWRVLEFDEPCLITSDEPVALVRDDSDTPGEGGGLPFVRWIVFPIDPRRALILVRPDLEGDEGWRRGRPDEANMINRHVAFSGHKFVVRTPGTDPLAGITVPRKAPPVFVVAGPTGSTVVFAPQVSMEARARQLTMTFAPAPG